MTNKQAMAEMQRERTAASRRRFPYLNKTKAELLAERERLTSDPANKGEGIFLYNSATRRKLEQIASAMAGAK